MGRSLTITVTLLGGILGFGCNAPRVTSVGSVGSVEPGANQSFPTTGIDPLSADAPSIAEESEIRSKPVSSAGSPEEADPASQIPVEPPVEPKTTPLQQAEELLAGGELEEALEAFADILLNNPGQIEAYVGLANTHEQLENPWAAERSWRRVVELQPDNAQAVLRHGNVLLQIGRTKEAERSWIRCLTLVPDDAEPLIRLAMLELERNQPEAALPYARSSVRLDPQSARARTVYARSLLGVGQPTASIPHWNMAIEARPEDFSLLAGLLEAYAQCQDYEGALATALVLNRRSPSSEVYERIGWCSFKLGDYQASQAAYEQATTLDPNCTSAWNGLGILALNRWLEQNRQSSIDRQEAIKAFRNSLRSDPDQPKLTRMMLRFDLDQ
ncbi:MAG: tetratricopeptide repeat protein [Planctomycetota bacterium]|nr:tetratricopeptide repeat protein [Planctomycetota bacterium]